MRAERKLCIVATLVASAIAVAAPAISVITASPGELPEGDELAMCSLGCAIGWDTKASSTLPNQGRNSYDVGNIDDSEVKTAWVEGAEGYGIGESITYTFTKEHFETANLRDRSRVRFSGFLVLNGYCSNARAWAENSRVKRMRIDINGSPLYDVVLNDSMNLQRVALGDVYLKPGDNVKVTILEIFPGTIFQDTALSALIPTGAH